MPVKKSWQAVHAETFGLEALAQEPGKRDRDKRKSDREGRFVV